MKKIAINCRTLNKRHGGPKRFLLNLLLNLAKIDAKNEYTLILDKPFSFGITLPQNFNVVVLRTNSRFFYEYFKLPYFLNKKLKPDIFIIPDPCFSPLIKGKKISVIHDLIYFENGQEREFKYLENLHHRIMIPICSKVSNLVLCVSNFTQSRARLLLGLQNTKMIYEGVEDSFQPNLDRDAMAVILKKYNITQPYFFYVGSLSPRKNIERLIGAFMVVKESIPHNLYLAGGYSWNDGKIKKLLADGSIKRRIKKIGFIEERDLPTIYSGAEAFLYPSLYEGFGLPILEAQACGCPVITSDFGAMKEIAGEGAILVDTYRFEKIADAMVSIAGNPGLRVVLSGKGRSNLSRFSWRSFARELTRSYESL